MNQGFEVVGLHPVWVTFSLVKTFISSLIVYESAEGTIAMNKPTDESAEGAIA